MNKPKAFKRKLLQLAGLLPFASFVKVSNSSEAEAKLSRIAFGSCLHQDKPQPIWEAVLKEQAELFIFLGDNIYGDSDDPQILKQKYQKQANNPGFRQLRVRTDVIATWDDHDYGRNDAGVEYPAKESSRQLMLEFWNEPVGSERWNRPDGIYTSYFYGPPGQRVQVILLDLRWNRTPLQTVSTQDELNKLDKANQGPYIPSGDSSAQLMGEAQWQWFENELTKPAEVRIIASSIQVLADFTGWETWMNFPVERTRLINLLAQQEASLSLLISGDVHWCELSRLNNDDSRPLIELTSSGLTETWEKISPNKNRLGNAFAVPNFGLINIDWNLSPPGLNLKIKDQDSKVLINYEYPR